MPIRAALGTRLLLLLLGFGALPVAFSVAIGYLVSRSIIVDRAERSLDDIVVRQAMHITTELGRERLLLRTIAGQLTSGGALASRSPDALARALTQALPDDGVFDGLRIVTGAGVVLTAVSLRHAAPHWPDRVPAGDWRTSRIHVHRDGGRAVAYLLAAPVERDTAFWIEGHVRDHDFLRLFGIPEHIANGLESAVFDTAGNLIAAGHAHASLMARPGAWSAGSSSLRLEVLDGERYLTARVRIAGTDWVYGGGLELAVALAALQRLRNSAALGIVALVAILVATAAVAARSITRPIRELTTAIEHFGHTGVLLPERTHRADEIGLLSHAFEQMATDLQQSRRDVELLHQRELERAQQLASVGELASGVAHEIRNPLAGVLGALELARRGLTEKDPALPLLDEAEAQLRRIERATAQLLQYARPPALRQVPVDIADVVRRAVHVVEPRANASNVAVRQELPRVHITVLVDPEAMIQVLVNLLLNGVQAMEGGGDLLVWAAPHAPHVWIGVQDHGAGVPADRRASIFRPFFTTKHQGTGLGLSISRQIVERQSGSIWYEETPGGGATLVVSLPLHQVGP